jgi:large subunit ribosomal protein L17
MHRHQYKGRKLGREAGPRRALLRNLTTSVILHERVTTTLAKAKEVAPHVEKMITLAKDGSLPAQRRLGAFLYDTGAISKLLKETAQTYKDRQGGYTRVMQLGPRVGDGAQMAIIELVDYTPTPKKVKKTAKAEGAEGDKSTTQVMERPAHEMPQATAPSADARPTKQSDRKQTNLNRRTGSN